MATPETPVADSARSGSFIHKVTTGSIIHKVSSVYLSSVASFRAARRQIRKRRNSLSLHVRDEILRDTEDPFAAIEGLAQKDSKDDSSVMLKLSSQNSWQPRRLICTSKRLYLLASRIVTRGNEPVVEIADSIPLREITSISEITAEMIQHIQNSSIKAFSVKLAGQLSQYSKSSENNSTETAAIQFSAAYQNDRIKRDYGEIFKAVDVEWAFEIKTESDGFNQGGLFWFSAGSKEARDDWLFELQKVTTAARKAFERQIRIKKLQDRAQMVCRSGTYQTVVVLAITANFVITLAQAQIDSASNNCKYAELEHENSDLSDSFNKVDIAFTFLFLSELLFNFVANAFWPFVLNRWNWLDVVVVTLSLGTVFVSSASNGVVKLARILRVFRLFRLFGRVSMLREIITAVANAILPAIQALLIALFVMAIYAAIGIEIFSNEKLEGFCDFFHAFYTLFSVIAYSEDGGITIFDEAGHVLMGRAAFVYSFVAIVVIVMLQVVVAVLLDSFYRSRQRDAEKTARNAAARERMLTASQYPLDPLLEQIVSTFDTAEDLSSRLHQIFKAFDTDRTGTLSFYELYAGLFKLNGVRLTFENFEQMTEGVVLCNDDTELDEVQFGLLMVRQLRSFIQRRTAETMFLANLGAEMVSVLTTLKLVTIELDRIKFETEGLSESVRRQERMEHKMLGMSRKIDMAAQVVESGLGLGASSSASPQSGPVRGYPSAGPHSDAPGADSITTPDSIFFAHGDNHQPATHQRILKVGPVVCTAADVRVTAGVSVGGSRCRGGVGGSGGSGDSGIGRRRARIQQTYLVGEIVMSNSSAGSVSLVGNSADTDSTRSPTTPGIALTEPQQL